MPYYKSPGRLNLSVPVFANGKSALVWDEVILALALDEKWCLSAGWDSQDDPRNAQQTLLFDLDGSVACFCQDYKTSVFAAKRTDSESAIWCPHVLCLHAQQSQNLLTEVVRVEDAAGVMHFVDWSRHTESADPAEDVLPLTIYFYRRNPRIHSVKSWQCGVSPVGGTEGKIWNVYYKIPRPQPSVLAVLRGQGTGQDLIHVGLYEADQPLLTIAQMIAGAFHEVALGWACRECGERADPSQLASHKFEMMSRGIFIEQHNGCCPSCAVDDTIPWVNDSW